MEYKVNLCMATYNRLSLTKQSISSIIDTASDNIPFMISVIDNGSNDGTPNYLNQLFEEKKIHNLVLMPKNIGIAKAHNILWKHYENIPYYAKIDNDITFNKNGWLNDLLEILEHCPSVGVLGYIGDEYNHNHYPVVNDNGYKYRSKNGNIGGACFFVPKHIKDRLGFWCEEFDLYGEEDAEYGNRILSAGLKNAYMEDETVMNHLSEDTQHYKNFKIKQRNDNISNNIFNTMLSKNMNKFVDSNSINTIPHEFRTNI